MLSIFTHLRLHKNYHHIERRSEQLINEMTTELPIEREANLRAQKKKILQLQKLKYLSRNFEITDGNVAATGTHDKHLLFTQERRINSSDHKVIHEKNPAVVACGRDEWTTNSLALDGENDGKVGELGRSETRGFSSGIKTPLLLRGKRPSAEETSGSSEAGTKTNGVKISIVVDNAEAERYTPSFASGSSEYHRKTNEIKKRADERRRNVASPSNLHSSLLNLSTNDYLTVCGPQPRRSASLTELDNQHNGSDFNMKRAGTYTSHRRRSKSEDMKVRSPYAFAELDQSFPRAASLSSIYDTILADEKREINFEGFARKQQELLEDNLRRLEKNLDITFSKLRRYVNNANARSRTENQGQT